MSSKAQRPAYNAAPAPLGVGPAKPYSYAYEVVDPAGGNAYGHRETSSGDGIISGEYRVVLPDTRTQIVKYSVSAETGYVAEVTYDGTPTFPEATTKRVKHIRYTNLWKTASKLAFGKRCLKDSGLRYFSPTH